MIKGEYEYLKGLAGINECAEHGTPLLVATHPIDACYVLRCGHDHYPDTIRHIPSLTEEYKRGNLPDGPIADNIKKRSRQKATTQPKNTKSLVLGEIPGADLGTGDPLVPDQIQSILAYASRYGLDAYRSHVVIYYGKPYVGLDGYLYHAGRSGKDYSLESRPMTTEELAQYKIGETDHAWIAKVHFIKEGTEFSGVGIVTYDEMTARSKKDDSKLRSPVVAAHPWQSAQKRAEWQALRRAFPIGEAEQSTQEEKDNYD